MLPGDPRPPEQVIKPEYLTAYKTAHADIYHRLIQINTSIEILETVAQYHYPLTCIVSPQDPFFHMLHWNFSYTCIVMLHAIWKDSKGHTIPQFKNKLSSWVLDSEKQFLHSRLKIFKDSDEMKSLWNRLSVIRNKVVAHRDHLVVSGSFSKQDLTIKDLREMYNETETLFSACSFRAEHETSLYLEGTVGGKPIGKDIERIMNLLVKYSHWINEPEIKVQFWPALRQHVSQADLDELNLWRAKFDLPPA